MKLAKMFQRAIYLFDNLEMKQYNKIVMQFKILALVGKLFNLEWRKMIGCHGSSRHMVCHPRWIVGKHPL